MLPVMELQGFCLIGGEAAFSVFCVPCAPKPKDKESFVFVLIFCMTGPAY